MLLGTQCRLFRRVHSAAAIPRAAVESNGWYAPPNRHRAHCAPPPLARISRVELIDPRLPKCWPLKRRVWPRPRQPLHRRATEPCVCQLPCCSVDVCAVLLRVPTRRLHRLRDRPHAVRSFVAIVDLFSHYEKSWCQAQDLHQNRWLDPRGRPRFPPPTHRLLHPGGAPRRLRVLLRAPLEQRHHGRPPILSRAPRDLFRPLAPVCTLWCLPVPSCTLCRPRAHPRTSLCLLVPSCTLCRPRAHPRTSLCLLVPSCTFFRPRALSRTSMCLLVPSRTFFRPRAPSRTVSCISMPSGNVSRPLMAPLAPSRPLRPSGLLTPLRAARPLVPPPRALSRPILGLARLHLRSHCCNAIQSGPRCFPHSRV